MVTNGIYGPPPGSVPPLKDASEGSRSGFGISGDRGVIGDAAGHLKVWTWPGARTPAGARCPRNGSLDSYCTVTVVAFTDAGQTPRIFRDVRSQLRIRDDHADLYNDRLQRFRRPACLPAGKDTDTLILRQSGPHRSLAYPNGVRIGDQMLWSPPPGARTVLPVGGKRALHGAGNPVRPGAPT